MGINFLDSFLLAQRQYSAVAERCFVHVSCPIVGPMDVDRADGIDRNHAGRVRPIEGSIKPAAASAGSVNVCTHRFGDCDCYDNSGLEFVFIAVHSVYYLQEAEWLSVYNRIGDFSVHAAIHYPEPQGQLPRDNPEFVWGTPDTVPEVFTWQQCTLSRIRNLLMGDPMVAMCPLQAAGTVYKHTAMSWLSAGGKHISWFSAWLDGVTQSWDSFVVWAFLLLATAVGMLLCAGCVWETLWNLSAWYVARRSRLAVLARFSPLLGVPLVGVLSEPLVCWLFVDDAPLSWTWFGTACALWTALFTMVVVARAVVLTAGDPDVLTLATLSFVHRTCLGDSSGDRLVDILEFTMGPPRPLESTVILGQPISAEVRRTSLAILLAGPGDATAVNRTTAAMLRRYNYSVSTTVGSVTSARQAALALSAQAGDSVTGSGLLESTTPRPIPRRASALRAVRMRPWLRVAVSVFVALTTAIVLLWLTAGVQPTSWVWRSRSPGWWAIVCPTC